MISRTVYAFPLAYETGVLPCYAAVRRFPYSQILEGPAPAPQSVVVFAPVETLESTGTQVLVTNREQQVTLENIDTLSLLAERVEAWGGRFLPDPTLPAFQGGAVGFFGATLPGAPGPAFLAGIYDQGFVFDHENKAAWFFSAAISEEHARARHEHALRLLAEAYEPDMESLQPAPLWQESCTRERFTAMIRESVDCAHSGAVSFLRLMRQYRALVPAGFDPLHHYARLRVGLGAPCMAQGHFGAIGLTACGPEGLILGPDRALGLALTLESQPRREGSLRDETVGRSLRDAAFNRHPATKALRMALYETGVTDVREVSFTAATGADHIAGLYFSGRAPEGLRTALGLMTGGGRMLGQPPARAASLLHRFENGPRTLSGGAYGFAGFDGRGALAWSDPVFMMEDDIMTLRLGVDVVSETSADDAAKRCDQQAAQIMEAGLRAAPGLSAAG